ncbi:UDP-glucuronosyltransferase 1A5 [Labeo rohita]|uniref:UDP-glucuronosyltransferase 1A5 n=1 Tax=Labeo rohita TaxID=84645 RepID=A0ABQ8MDB6_LABRO|nr:UDP-glucuronosyltransferase 1A5 [Labeo rohita]
MNLWQRSMNLVRALLKPTACRRLFTLADEIASRVLQRKTSMVEIMSQAALWFMRSDFAFFEFPQPQMPNMVMIGGMATKKPKPLSQAPIITFLKKKREIIRKSLGEMEEFVNGSGEHGFVVLWRNTGPVPQNAPKNVKLMKWLPQNDLWGMDNVQRLVSRGVAETLRIYDLTSEKLLVALRKVINDKSYKEKITELSAIHRDRPIEPLDLAVFWTEFVMRHKGAAHLRPAAHELNWIQYHSLDVIAFLLLILVTVIFVSVRSCMFCFRKCFRKTQKRKRE